MNFKGERRMEVLFWQKSSDKLTAWMRENAIVFESAENTEQSIEKLSFLDELLKDKRVVYLGEEDHWIHEKYEYRSLLLSYLISRGWHYIGEELGWSDGLRIDRYLATGESSHLERIATYGYSGDKRTDREDIATGLLRDVSDHYPVQEFKAEQIRFVEFLRKFNVNSLHQGQRVHFFGFDVNAVPGSGYHDLSELLGQVLHTPEVVEIQKLLSRVPGESIEGEIKRLSDLLDAIEDKADVLRERLGEDRCAQLKQWLLTMRDSFAYYHLANQARDYKGLNKALAIREELMCRHVEFILAQMKPEGKLVLMGHNRHLAKESERIKKLGPAPPGGKLVPALGTHLYHRFPGQVFSIWMLHESGKSSQPFASISSEYTVKPGSLNSLLAQVGTRYLLPMHGVDPRARLLRTRMDIVGIYNASFRAAMAEQADAIYFVRKVTPLAP